MADLILNSQVQTQARDFLGLRQAFFEYAQANYSDVWSDFNSNSFAAAIAELIAYLGDSLHYYIDRQTADNFITTTKDRQAAIDLAALIDYTPSNAEPASGEVTLTLEPGTFNYGSPILPGFQVSNGAGVTFETNSTTPVTIGATSVVVGVVEGTTIQETAGGLGILAVADGSPNQEYVLSRQNVILSRTSDEININEDLIVTVGGVLYTATNTLSTAQSTDKFYTVRTNDSNETIIKFGNGEFGTIPPLGQDIEVIYRSLSTERDDLNYGNLNSNTVQTLVTIRTGVLSVSNDSPFTGGAPRESLEEIKLNAPASLSALHRAVALPDFEVLAKEVAGVSKAKALPGEGSLDVTLYAAPNSGGNPTTTLKNTIQTYFQDKKLAKVNITLQNPVYQNVLVGMKIFINNAFKQQEVLTNVATALEDLFSFNNMDFGRAVYQKSTNSATDTYDIYETLENIPGINRVVMEKFSLKPQIYVKQEDNSGTLRMFSRNPLLREDIGRYEYQIDMVNANEFHLTKQLVGNSLTLNDTTISDLQVDFTISTGTSTDVGSTFLQDGSKIFKVNEFSGELLVDSSGNVFVIASNTADTITLVSGTPTAGTYYVVKNFEGWFINPNTKQTQTFKITSNTSNTFTVATGGFTSVAAQGDEYVLFRPETNKFAVNPLAGKEDALSSTTSNRTFTTQVTQIVDSSIAGVYADDSFNGYQIVYTSGPAINEIATVQDFIGASGTFILSTPGIIETDPGLTANYTVAPKYIAGVNGTVDAGALTPTTTTFADPDLAGRGNDFFNGWSVKFLTGPNIGLFRTVNDYDSATGTFTIDAASASVDGNSFELVKSYEDDEQTLVFGVVRDSNVVGGDQFFFLTSDLVGDLLPRPFQILQIDTSEAAGDLTLVAVGGIS